MTKVYACLAGEWVCLNDNSECVIGINHQSPFIWWEEGAEIYAPISRANADTMYSLDYVHINYKGKDWRINPMFIQIVTE